MRSLLSYTRSVFWTVGIVEILASIISHTFDLVADILGNTAEVVREHYGKWSRGRQDNIDRAMLAHFATMPDAFSVTRQSHEKTGAAN